MVLFMMLTKGGPNSKPLPNYHYMLCYAMLKRQD